jgi:drug/metabolite transporter (DMT)-like permease
MSNEHLSYLYLILAICCVSGLGISHKVTDLRGCKPASVNLALFAAASIVMWLYTIAFKVLLQGQSQIPPLTSKAIAIAAICGLCACFGILTFQNGVRYGRITTSWLIVNLSALMPTALAFLLYQDQKTLKWQHFVALALTTCSILLLWKDKQCEAARQGAFPVANAAEVEAREPFVPAGRE